MTASFAEILAPITPAEFFAGYHGRAPLHVPGGAGKFSGVMTRAKLDELIGVPGLWTAQSLQMARDSAMVPPGDYLSPASGPNAAPDPAKLRALLAGGASLVLNDIDMAAPGLAGVADVACALEDALESKVQANLYSSPRERQAFASHYDTHDVFAVHIEGEKLWRVYEGRIDNPIEHPAFKSQTRAFHDQAKGKVAREVLMKPGDLLYLPRGQYHDAVALSERTIHVAFGAVGVIGLDMVSALFARAVDDPLFRADLPRRHGAEAGAGEAAFAARLQALGKRLADLAADPAGLAAMRQFQDGFRYRAPSGAQGSEPRYRVTARDFTVAAQGGGWMLMRGGKGTSIPPGLERAVAWIVARESFADAELAQAFPALGDEARGELLRSLTAMKVVAKL
jgi:mannose-6-phosphate isomerase-like protein (cupin superfamily)